MFQALFRTFVFSILLVLVLFGLPSYSMSQGVEAWSNLGLYGGQMYDIAIDPSNPDKMFAGSYMGDGLFVTEDGGSSWRAVETENEPEGEGTFKNHAVWAVKIAPSDNNVIWVAHNYWVEKSTHGGQTWTHIRNSTMQRDCPNCGGEGDNFRFCRSLAIDPMNPAVVYVGTGGPDGAASPGAIYKTTNGGDTWMKTGFDALNDFDHSVVDIDIDPQNSNVIWAVTNSFGYGGWAGTLYRSEDGGQTWIVVFTIAGSFYDVEVKPNGSNTVFTGNAWGIFKHYYDDDTGEWKYEWILNYWGQWPPPSDIVFARQVQSLAFDPQNPNVIYATWKNPWGGDPLPKVARGTPPYGDADWEIYTVDHEFLTLTVHPTNSEVVFGGELSLGVYKSQDHGQTWTPINNGINAVIVKDVDIDPKDSSHILAATIAGLYEKKGAKDWSLISDFPYSSAFSAQFHPTNSQTFYAGIEGQLAKTIDAGEGWTFSNWLDASGNAYNSVEDIGIDPINTDTVFIAVDGFGNYGEIYKSTDGGDTFNQVLEGVNQSDEKYPFNAVAIDPSDPQHIFAGGGSFHAPKVFGNLWESKDGGVKWDRNPLSFKDVIVNDLLIDPQNPNIMYAGCGYSGGMGDENEAPLYKSTNSGVTWTASYEGIPGYPTPWNAVTDLEFHRENTNVVYASTNAAGVYISPNQAGNWLNLGKPEYDVYAIATSSLYAATQGGLLQCTGTGVIAGQVTDAPSQADINNATVFNDMGAKTISINGEYMMVSPSGVCDVTAIADGYANKTMGNVTVYGGDVSWVDIAMQSGVSEPSATGDGSGGGGGGCFIATAAYGSPLSKQVEILRKFRYTYLLRYSAGQELVGFYYRTGKPVAIYIESHPWLKGLARVILYPMVGLAWLLLSTTAFAKGVIGVCVLICCVGAVRKVKTRKNIPEVR